MHHFESAACWSSAEACRGSSSPKTWIRRALAPGRRAAGRLRSRPGSRRRQLAHHLAPAPGKQLQLAVAVELVAEEVPEQTARGRTRRATSGSAASSTSKRPELRVARGEQGRSDPGDEVRARAVVGQANRWREDLGRHRSGRRLAVRRRDERRPLGKASREAVDGARDRASRGASPALSCLHRRRRRGRGRPPPRANRISAERESGRRTGRTRTASPVRGNFRGPRPFRGM